MISHTSDYKANNWTEITKKDKNKQNKQNNPDDEFNSIPMGKCLISISQIWDNPCAISKLDTDYN